MPNKIENSFSCRVIYDNKMLYIHQKMYRSAHYSLLHLYVGDIFSILPSRLPTVVTHTEDYFSFCQLWQSIMGNH